MSKKKKGGESKMILLAAVGVGAFILYKRAGASANVYTSNGAGLTSTSVVPLMNSSTVPSAPAQLTAGQLQNHITQAYASDSDNLAKINQWISTETNPTIRSTEQRWLATTDINQRSFLANYWDYVKSGYNQDILLAGTMPFLTEVDRLKASTGFHL